MKTKILFLILLFSSVFFVGVNKTQADAIMSACENGQDSGSQTQCRTDDAFVNEVLDQCRDYYGDSSCTSMAAYLASLASSCNRLQPDGINCSVITTNNIYGREASEMALCLDEAKTNETGECVGTSGDDAVGAATSGDDAVGAPLTAAKCSAGFEEVGGVCFPTQTGLADTDVKSIVTTILYWLLGIFGVLAIIAFAISGVQYLISAGNEDMIETAKRNMTWSIVGVIVALSGLVIIRAIDTALKGQTFF